MGGQGGQTVGVEDEKDGRIGTLGIHSFEQGGSQDGRISFIHVEAEVVFQYRCIIDPVKPELIGAPGFFDIIIGGLGIIIVEMRHPGVPVVFGDEHLHLDPEHHRCAGDLRHTSHAGIQSHSVSRGQRYRRIVVVGDCDDELRQEIFMIPLAGRRVQTDDGGACPDHDACGQVGAGGIVLQDLAGSILLTVHGQPDAVGQHAPVYGGGVGKGHIGDGVILAAGTADKPVIFRAGEGDGRSLGRRTLRAIIGLTLKGDRYCQ